MKLLANLGDESPLSYGGLLVIENDGRCHIETWEEPGSDNKITVYRVGIDKFTYVDGVLSDNPYHPDHPVWFADKLGSVAESCGWEVDELIRMFLSEDPVQRAEGYRMVAEYYGWHELDQYPLGMSVEAAARRYQAFELGEVSYKYLLLDQVWQYCRERLDKIADAPPEEDAYWLGERNGRRNTYNDVMKELMRIEYSWD
jgi:hypothetical protein